jgi:hypothetical protein
MRSNSGGSDNTGGSLDREKIRDAIAATNMTTVVGPVRFRPDGTGEVEFFPAVVKGQAGTDLAQGFCDCAVWLSRHLSVNDKRFGLKF